MFRLDHCPLTAFSDRQDEDEEVAFHHTSWQVMCPPIQLGQKVVGSVHIRSISLSLPLQIRRPDTQSLAQFILTQNLNPRYPIISHQSISTIFVIFHKKPLPNVLCTIHYPVSALQRGPQPVPLHNSPHPRRLRLLIPRSDSLSAHKAATVLSSFPS